MVAKANHQIDDDYVIDQNWSTYTDADHAIWRDLFMRQSHLLPNRACNEFMAGLEGLGVAADQIPDFEALSAILMQATGWQIVAVPGLVPDDVFFRHLSERRFPATNWIRRRDQMDYLQEPDVFHDVFGHVPLLMNPVFADYLQAYGRGGLKALGLGALPLLARLYWYSVEFGLIKTEDGLRIYGSGIVSSFSETRYCLESNTPLRLGFDLRRIMRTRYRIDNFQETYFVIDNFDQLFDATAPDFSPIYERVASLPEINPGAAISNDTMITLSP
ncbi:MAG: phenylalanine 4-monooxygenase [Rhodospirillaceae bacterium]|jgi:phenylalanine-4-hydroxylase|nr:phenylalanine 4-monooxygenase [Rhodospirillaceae bacterium]MBT5458732.1 phenylalanine 4-monooxygenase [Rhodospirillaceae bacterium]